MPDALDHEPTRFHHHTFLLQKLLLCHLGGEEVGATPASSVLVAWVGGAGASLLGLAVDGAIVLRVTRRELLAEAICGGRFVSQISRRSSNGGSVFNVGCAGSDGEGLPLFINTSCRI